jgi:peptidoglycan hydrolase CwlO-like protein
MFNLESLALKATTWIGSTSSLIVHTIVFIVSFSLVFFGIPIYRVLLVLTTILSLEAIYLSIFIQMSVNRHESKLHEVSEDIDEIQEDIEDISDDIDDISEDLAE